VKKLTDIEIEKLFVFTKKHYVDYYDLQLELVDHLSNGIEAQWQENATLSFNDALQKEFKKFGIFGFTDLVDERRAKMCKRYNKLILTILKTYITLPKVIVSVMLFLATYLVLSFVPYNNYIVIVLFVVPFLIMFYKTIAYRVQRKKAIKVKNRIWMFEEIITSYGDKVFLIQILIQFPQSLSKPIFWQNILGSSLGLFTVSFLLVLFLLVVYIIIYVIPSKAKEHIMAIHPEYGLV
jgi:lysylphosphatidylglycerol synthetase-like protein (DUF2156 family)